MFDRPRFLVPLALALVLPVSASAADPVCTPLPAGLEICTGGTGWADADILEFDNGIMLDADALRVELIEAPAPLDAITPFADALDALRALIVAQAMLEGLAAPEFLSDNHVQSGENEALILQTRIDLPEDDPFDFASMVLDVQGQRLLGTMSYEAGLDAAQVDQHLAELAALIRPRQE
jgi:hypothetical protein